MDYEHEIYVIGATNDEEEFRAIIRVSKPELKEIEKFPRSPITTGLLKTRLEDTFPEKMVGKAKNVMYDGSADIVTYH